MCDAMTSVLTRKIMAFFKSAPSKCTAAPASMTTINSCCARISTKTRVAANKPRVNPVSSDLLQQFTVMAASCAIKYVDSFKSSSFALLAVSLGARTARSSDNGLRDTETP